MSHTRPVQVVYALQRHASSGKRAGSTHATVPNGSSTDVSVAAVEAVLARELRDVAATKAKRKERKATAFAAWHQTKQVGPGTSVHPGFLNRYGVVVSLCHYVGACQRVLSVYITPAQLMLVDA